MRLGLVTILGAAFGFVLSRARATDYDTIAGMFRLTDLHLMGVIGVAIGISALGLWLLRRAGNRTIGGEPIGFGPKPWHAGALRGGLLFGAGWALTGACPGTSLVQVGEGKLVALFTVAGILAGTYLYGWLRSLPTTAPPARPLRTTAAPSR